jgi:hypothetical protein
LSVLPRVLSKGSVTAPFTCSLRERFFSREWERGIAPPPGPAQCEVVGRWRIVGSNVWDCDDLDLKNPPSSTSGGVGAVSWRSGS